MVRIVAAGRQLARSLELPSVNDLGFTKTYVRCLQTAEVVNSMMDLVDITRDTKIGPIGITFYQVLEGIYVFCTYIIYRLFVCFRGVEKLPTNAKSTGHGNGTGVEYSGIPG